MTRSEVSPEATEEFDTLLAKLAQAIREERGGVASFACYRISGMPNARVVIELSWTTLRSSNSNSAPRFEISIPAKKVCWSRRDEWTSLKTLSPNPRHDSRG